MRLLYILIGCLWGYNNYRIMASGGKEDIFPIWYHVVAGCIWPVSMMTIAWIIYKKWKNDRKN